MRERHCRVWWPDHLSCRPTSRILLFGWCIHSAFNSLDFVITEGAYEDLVQQLNLEDVLDHVNKRMPESVKMRSTFRLLGCCGLVPSCDGISDSSNYKLNGFLEKYIKASDRIDDWVHLDYSREMGIKLRQLHSHGRMLPVNLAHNQMIMYELPSFGLHHFCLSEWRSLNQAIIPIKKPKWMAELRRQESSVDLDVIILALNCGKAAKDCLGFDILLHNSSVISGLLMVGWHVLAGVLASLCTAQYAILRLCHRLLTCRSSSFFLVILIKLFSQTSKNVQIRSSQFLYWPCFLQGSGSSSLPNVEHAHRASLRKHATWSSIAVDLLLGNILGLLVLLHADAIRLWVPQFSCAITDNLLRSGCVWLMGVPAGFKLNTELAELLGLISLNAIQIWSTLWFYMGIILRFSLIGLALFGMLFGATIALALCIDLLRLVALHVMLLHLLISFAYSRQIWVLTSLWRLFRGQKWNPLRQRVDSFEYSVDQHVVGSLLFTPILLLLPTTSVFYIFFTITNSLVSLVCITLEVFISILHATPYAELFLWGWAPRRFPSGLWLELRAARHQKEQVPFLRSNHAKIGHILGPHYRDIFSGISLSSVSSVCAVLYGQRVPSTLGVGLPKAMAWRRINAGGYWRLCRSAILAHSPES